MTSVTRKSNISVSAAQSGSTQNALKLSVATSFILCLDEDVVQADEASTLSLSTALPITLKLLINGFPCQEFVDSAFARAFLGYIKRVSPARIHLKQALRSNRYFTEC